MQLRPAQARWFETYVPHEHTVRVTEILARTGVVQLELDPRVPELVDTDKLRYFVQRYFDLAASYREVLPSGSRKATAIIGSPLRIANQALHRLRVWTARIDYLGEHITELSADRDYLLLLDEALESMEQEGLDFEGVFRRTQLLCKCLFACPSGCCSTDKELQSVVKVVVHGPRHDFLFMVGLPDQRLLIRKMVLEKSCEQVGIPAWLSGNHSEQRRQVRAHIAEIDADIARQENELQALKKDPQIIEDHANIDTLAWYLEHAARTLTEREMCHVTGWTTTQDPHRLQQALEDEGIRAIVRFPDPPAKAAIPVAPLDVWWSRPYQPLLLLWGTPGRTEVDPSGILALVAPLLFGYMFPDVGHGLVLALLALACWRRWPHIRFLLPCGIAAMAFGVLFGDVFGFHDIVPAQWLRPLDHPHTVLVVPLAFGVVLMLLGMVFAAFEAYWRGELREWLLVDGAVLLLYAALLAGMFEHAAFWLAGLAVLQYLAGTLMLSAEQRFRAVLSGIGALLLSMFELAMNTLSFLRVGAFALAHAALSHAILTVAEFVENPAMWLLVIVIGNLFSIVLEGLVVFVQTTRLVLFEFFTRFLQGEGRLFRPERKPPA